MQAVIISKGHAPCVILYTTTQIAEIRRVCGKQTSPDLRAVLAVDRTFNLSSLYVTLTVYKQRKVVRKSTGDSPIFIGPMLLHGDGKFATYLGFFSHLCGALNGDMFATEFKIQDRILTGSDEETALVSAVQTAFPNSSQLFCMLHCKELDNVRHHMTSIGLSTKLREAVLDMLFGIDELSSCGEEATLDNKTAEILAFLRQNNIEAVDYIQQRIIPKITNNCQIKWAESWLGQHQWSNNNCESANHVLKMALDWKPARLTELVDHLRDIVRLQYADLQWSLCGLGDFQITPSFARHIVTQVSKYIILL